MIIGKLFSFILLVLTLTVYWVIGFSIVKGVWNLILSPVFHGINPISTFESIILFVLLLASKLVYENYFVNHEE